MGRGRGGGMEGARRDVRNYFIFLEFSELLRR
jgi:hypothetical protein